MAILRGGRLASRIEALAATLDGGPAIGQDAVEPALTRLETAVAAVTAGQRATQARLSRLAIALAQVTEAVVVADEQGEICFRNAAAEAYVGARHGDALVERTLVDLLGRALVGEVGQEPLELWGPPRRMLVLSALPLRDGQRVIGALARVEDVSERRRLDAVRRDFVANIGHELKTPVGALSLLSEALEDEVDVQEFRRLTSSMQREALRLGQIIDDLLDLSRIEADETPVREPVPVHLIAEHAVERVRTLADHQAIHLDMAPIDPTLTVLGDRRQLVNALDNLLENAVKYSDHGFDVRLSAGLEGGVLTVAVEDHGIGIPTRDLERIFERFYRVDRARARDTGGTGLGLSIVRHIAHNHGGEVHVTSREGEGSTFTLKLPPGPPTRPPAPPTPDLAPTTAAG
ncbi:MAG: Phosphate regulon sensor protein PhoR (SphS) [uncultured Acidimicrobiales bacterium]|uniref:Sensor-like histidine kinase SenX3 n=1 Tax=uncultured Acidimicrobiales bacterium TaxID=310071 RepID=A0A6J4HY92_9ACTN|nr:MAG: Phosphate regulon sensor protein PhoR (SphS) [uncultured Acidimicrobiales bacterium]